MLGRRSENQIMYIISLDESEKRIKNVFFTVKLKAVPLCFQCFDIFFYR